MPKPSLSKAGRIFDAKADPNIKKRRQTFLNSLFFKKNKITPLRTRSNTRPITPTRRVGTETLNEDGKETLEHKYTCPILLIPILKSDDRIFDTDNNQFYSKNALSIYVNEYKNYVWPVTKQPIPEDILTQLRTLSLSEKERKKTTALVERHLRRAANDARQALGIGPSPDPRLPTQDTPPTPRRIAILNPDQLSAAASAAQNLINQT